MLVVNYFNYSCYFSQVEMNEEQFSCYQELLTYINGWLSSMEGNIDRLKPVCLHTERLESQIESMQVTERVMSSVQLFPLPFNLLPDL